MLFHKTVVATVGLMGVLLLNLAYAQDSLKDALTAVEKATAEKTQIQDQLKNNVTKKRELEQGYRDITAQKKDYDHDLSHFNDYCSGEFPEPEFTARKTWCDGHSPALETQRDKINGKLQALDEEDKTRIAQAQQLSQSYQSVNIRLEALRGNLQDLTKSNPKCANFNTVETLYCCLSGVDSGQCTINKP
jgi:uncharacterized phage infection (PIP) family protein YhgE